MDKMQETVVQEFEVDHLEAFKNVGLTWPPVIEGELLKRVEYLPRRYQELVFF